MLRALAPGALGLGLVLALVAGPEMLRGAPPAYETNGEVVLVSLRPVVTVAGPEVTVGDVASLAGGSFELQQRIARLDLAELAPANPTADVRKEQIAFRIQIAGVEPRLFRVEGAARVSVGLAGQQVTEETLLAAAQKLLRERMPWPAEDIVIRLAEPIDVPPLAAEASSQIHLEADLQSTSTPLGRVGIDVAVFVNGEPRARVPICLDVKLYQEVAVATRRIERGDLLGEDNLHFDRRAVDGMNYLGRKDNWAGKRSRRTILPGQVIAGFDVEAAPADHPVLVKPQERVKLQVRVGSLRVTAAGEALQEGRAGQLIRVRNVDSKAVIQGRVVERALVEVNSQ